MRSRMPSRVRRALAALLTPMLVLSFFNVLPTPAGAAVNRDVLVLAADDPTWVADVQSKLQGTGLFSSVQTQDVGTTTPALADLSGYEAVLVFSDSSFADPTALGDVLADYVDAGGQVAVATFATNSSSGELGGRIVTGSYLPFTAGAETDGTRLQMVKDQPSSPLLAGVGAFDGGDSTYHSLITLAPGATLVAHWNDAGATPLVVLKVAPSGAAVVGLNMFPPSSDARVDFWDASTDGTRLMANALLPLAQQPDGLIRKLHSGFVGNNVYNTTAALQTVKSRAHRRDVRKFLVRVANDGNAGATFVMQASSSRGVRVRYLAGGVDVTTAMTSAGGLSFTAAPGAFKEILVKMKVGRHARIGSRKSAMVTASWTGSPVVRQDAVKAVVRVR